MWQVSVEQRGDDWVELTEGPLDVAAAVAWVVQPSCGGVVAFVGTVRDHSEGRPGVTEIEYEAYPEYVESRLRKVASEARDRCPDVGRLALLHRTGRLAVTDASVVVAASAPHRDEAFDAARLCIDTLKATVPIWKREVWAGGEGWSAAGHELAEAGHGSSTAQPRNEEGAGVTRAVAQA